LLSRRQRRRLLFHNYHSRLWLLNSLLIKLGHEFLESAHDPLLALSDASLNQLRYDFWRLHLLPQDLTALRLPGCGRSAFARFDILYLARPYMLLRGRRLQCGLAFRRFLPDLGRKAVSHTDQVVTPVPARALRLLQYLVVLLLQVLNLGL